MKNKDKNTANKQAQTQAPKQSKKSKAFKQISHHDMLFKQGFSDPRFARVRI